MTSLTIHLGSSINSLYFGARTSVARWFCYHDSDLIVCAAHFASGEVSDSPFYHIMRMLIMHVLP